MAEYIEIEQLWKCETCYHNGQHGCTLGLGCDHGENYRPAYSKLKKADVAPVIRGRWECEHETWGRLQCSNCKKEALLEKSNGDVGTILLYVTSNYCPNCGAHMKDGE